VTGVNVVGRWKRIEITGIQEGGSFLLQRDLDRGFAMSACLKTKTAPTLASPTGTVPISNRRESYSEIGISQLTVSLLM
jgi:hypothetical protein